MKIIICIFGVFAFLLVSVLKTSGNVINRRAYILDLRVYLGRTE
jgi:hypothetical protein